MNCNPSLFSYFVYSCINIQWWPWQSEKWRTLRNIQKYTTQMVQPWSWIDLSQILRFVGFSIHFSCIIRFSSFPCKPRCDKFMANLMRVIFPKIWHLFWLESSSVPMKQSRLWAFHQNYRNGTSCCLPLS